MTYDVQPDSYLQASSRVQTSNPLGLLDNGGWWVLFVLVLAVSAIIAAVGNNARDKRLRLGRYKQ